MVDKEGIKYGICKVSISPVRKSADDRSEMVSQLLFGELVEVYARKSKDWIKILCAHDGYVGWVDQKQFLYIEKKDFDKLQSCPVHALDWVNPALSGDNSIPIYAGSNLHAFDGLTLKSPLGRFQYGGQIVDARKVDQTSELVIKLARHFLNAPYLWGGRSPFGIDCSGLTQMVFKMMGYPLPRDASEQAECGEIVNFDIDAKPGDLAFFVNKDNKVIHVGIMLEDNMIIHASGWVRIDRLDHFGIYVEENQKYSHVLRIIKRVLPDITP